MAKSLFLILSLFYTVQAFLHIPKDIMKQTELECLAQTSVDYDTLQQYIAGQIPYNDNFGVSGLCFAKAVGVFNDESEYMKDDVVQKLQADGKDSDEAKAFADQCNIQKETPEKSADATLLCLYNYDP